MQGIRGDLYAIPHPAGNVLHKGIRRATVTLAHAKRGNQFRLGIYGAKCPHVTILRIVINPQMPLFFADESPYLIEL